MEIIVLMIGVAFVALLVLRPAPRTQVIYVPLAVETERGGLGCLPVLVLAGLALLVLLALNG